MSGIEDISKTILNNNWEIKQELAIEFITKESCSRASENKYNADGNKNIFS